MTSDYKYLVVVTFLLGVVAIEGKLNNATICKGIPPEVIVLLPHPTNCSLYIECANEVPVEMPCPDGLHWNTGARQCDYPDIAKCHLNKTQNYPTHENINKVKKAFSNCDGVPESINILLPNPNDCGSFIQCVHQKPIVRPCPPGLHWSHSLNRCEWPEIANCKIGICEGVPETEDVLLPNPEDCGTYIQCVHQKPVVRPCPPGLHWSASLFRCEWPQTAKCNSTSSRSISAKKTWTNCDDVPETIDVLLPNPKDCGTYIQCVHQKPLIRPCPSSLHWSVQLGRCEWPEVANCKSRTCEGVPETEDVLLPNPEDCGTYIQCVHQKPVVRPCPPGLHWSASLFRCEWPQTAKCNSTSSRSISAKKTWTNCEDVPETIDVLLPNPKDCGTYIQCVHQKPLIRPCPSSLHWSVQLGRCEWPEVANCKSRTCEGVPETEDVLLPNPEDCGTYIQCVHQKPVVRPCPTGLNWSESSKTCDWPDIAKCNISVNP